MKILVLAEVSDSSYKVGKEVKILSLAELLEARGHELILATSRDNASQPKGLPQLQTLRIMELPKNPVARRQTMAGIENYLAGAQSDLDLAVEAQVALLQEGMRGVDAVLIVGNAPMSSLNPQPLYEAALLSALAQSLRLPLIFTNQIVGSPLDSEDEQVLARTYKRASRIGISSEQSQNWCSQHGIRATPSVDLATLFVPKLRSLPSSENYDFLKEIGELPNAFVGVTLGNLPEGYVNLAAAMLDRLHREKGLCTVFIPHESNPKLQDGDMRVHREIASRMWSPTLVLPPLHADDAAGLHRLAAFNISSNPIVVGLGMAQGIPTFGFYRSSDWHASFVSAQANFGMQDFVAPVQFMASETIFAALLELADRFENYKNLELLGQSEKLRSFACSWWDIAHQVMQGELSASQDLPGIPAPEPLEVPEGSVWRSELRALNSAVGAVLRQAEDAQVRAEVAQGWADVYKRERDFAVRRAQESNRTIEQQSEQIMQLQAAATQGESRSGWGKLFGGGR